MLTTISFSYLFIGSPDGIVVVKGNEVINSHKTITTLNGDIVISISEKWLRPRTRHEGNESFYVYRKRIYVTGEIASTLAVVCKKIDYKVYLTRC